MMWTGTLHALHPKHVATILRFLWQRFCTHSNHSDPCSMPADAPTPSKAPNERSCYCDGLDSEFRRTHNLPDGYCGLCERCGQPGHTRHYPGPMPYTGAWCDRCYRILAWTWPLRLPAILIMAAIIAAVFYFVIKRHLNS